MTKRANLGVLLGALLVLLGLCFGWVGLRGFGGGIYVDGWHVLGMIRSRGWPYLAVYVVPLGALGAALAALVDRRLAARLGVLVGGGAIAWGAIELVRLLYRTTFVGLWLSTLGALVLLGAGLFSRER